ncbi:hypothetical protein [Ligilactobacillus acidipiscis]|uniref:Uncharacterized protein n=1 Tax=Ligilactobacillus acidipiscis TaxID=89059 RepID=A0A0R2JWZ5_9LACO|nr:hypothetical protein [Ligilactobacillus acidipiscis]KRN81646.1 hypothetical protein IV43_GL001823 [Ligilactobacillus acidipiscis]
MKNKTYFFTGSFKSKGQANLKSITWHKESGSYNFIFISDKEAFGGKYVDGQLNYGRFYQVTKAKSGFFNFKEKKFITAKNNYDELSPNKKEKYSLINSDQIPDAAGNTQYYQTSDPNQLRSPIKYRFYKVDGDLIREINPKKNVHVYTKNVLKDN